MHNRFVHNDAWGVLIQVQQGEGGKPCIGGQLNFSFLGVTLACLFDNWGNAILNNKFARQRRPTVTRPTATSGR